MPVSKGDSSSFLKAWAFDPASACLVITKGSPSPTRAIPSIRSRFTLDPIPKGKTFVSPRFSRIRSKAASSTETYPSVAMTTVREVPSVRGRLKALLSAGRSSVPPPPRWCSMRWTPCLMFSGVAGKERSERMEEPPAKSTTLKRSIGRRDPIRSLSKDFERSSGNPFMDPETSTTKMYSLGGICSARTRFGGWTMNRKKFSSLPS